MSCEMCGKFAGPSLIEAEVDGAVMFLCPQCSKFGSKVAKNKAGLSETSETEVAFVRSRTGEKGPSVSHVKVRTGEAPSTSSGTSRRRSQRDVLYSDKELVDNYGEVIKQARMEKGLSLEDFAQMINEKSSILQKIEKNEFTPPDQLIVKIERRLEISLKEEAAAATYFGTSSQKDTTLGDLVKLKKKKK